MRKRVVLAYSGGLDTSVAIKWLQEQYNADVITLTVDVGQEGDLDHLRERALRIGALDAVLVDGKKDFVDYFVFPALQAGALYEGVYPLATALSRPLIAYYLVQTAHKYGAEAVAHGCTGKGNDQVRLELAIRSLDPSLEVIAPVRDWSLNRDEELRYARESNIDVPERLSQYSVDANLWGRSIEAGILEDPSAEPPEEVFEWTVPIEATPSDPEYVTIGFQGGIPVSLDGQSLDGVALIAKLNKIGGRHGVGRIDHVENRLVGIKSREIYEAPAATILHLAHAALESITLSKDQARFKELVSREYAEAIYNGKRFSALHNDLMAYLASNQRYVTGDVRVKLHRGTCRVVGRQSPVSLYSRELATYESGDQFDHSAAAGFIKLYGMAQINQIRLQMLPEGNDPVKPLPKSTVTTDKSDSRQRDAP